jgi:hypothetical protein
MVPVDRMVVARAVLAALAVIQDRLLVVICSLLLLPFNSLLLMHLH